MSIIDATRLTAFFPNGHQIILDVPKILFPNEILSFHQRRKRKPTSQLTLESQKKRRQQAAEKREEKKAATEIVDEFSERALALFSDPRKVPRSLQITGRHAPPGRMFNPYFSTTPMERFARILASGQRRTNLSLKQVLLDDPIFKTKIALIQESAEKAYIDLYCFRFLDSVIFETEQQYYRAPESVTVESVAARFAAELHRLPGTDQSEPRKKIIIDLKSSFPTLDLDFSIPRLCDVDWQAAAFWAAVQDTGSYRHLAAFMLDPNATNNPDIITGSESALNFLLEEFIAPEYWKEVRERGLAACKKLIFGDDEKNPVFQPAFWTNLYNHATKELGKSDDGPFSCPGKPMLLEHVVRIAARPQILGLVSCLDLAPEIAEKQEQEQEPVAFHTNFRDSDIFEPELLGVIAGFLRPDAP